MKLRPYRKCYKLDYYDYYDYYYYYYYYYYSHVHTPTTPLNNTLPCEITEILR